MSANHSRKIFDGHHWEVLWMDPKVVQES